MELPLKPLEVSLSWRLVKREAMAWNLAVAPALGGRWLPLFIFIFVGKACGLSSHNGQSVEGGAPLKGAGARTALQDTRDNENVMTFELVDFEEVDLGQRKWDK